MCEDIKVSQFQADQTDLVYQWKIFDISETVIFFAVEQRLLSSWICSHISHLLSLLQNKYTRYDVDFVANPMIKHAYILGIGVSKNMLIKLC